MKKLICLALFAATINCAWAQTDFSEHTWRVTLKIVDETGQSVAGASAGVGYYHDTPPSNPKYTADSIDGVTDKTGVFTASGKCRPGLLHFAAEKNGYYNTRSDYSLGFQEYDPLKWNPIVTLVLKKIGQPIPMYARKAQIELPVVDKAVGFDLIIYDWVAPYGKGEQSDVAFETHRRWVNRRDFDSTIKITFPNSGNGLIAVPASSGQGSSGPRLPVTAPLNGYEPELHRGLSNTSQGGWKNDSKDQNYFLRIRTVLDAQGNIKSALYGKIYGDFTLDPINSKTTLVVFAYYLNSEPNSRNVEFDPNRNLFKKLPSSQQLKEP